MLALPCQKAFPLQLGDFIQETVNLLVLANGLANRILQPPRRTPLARLAGLAPHQIQGAMPFASDAMTIRLAALARALGERAAQDAFAGGQLGDARTETALGSGKCGATEVAVHVLYVYKVRIKN